MKNNIPTLFKKLFVICLIVAGFGIAVTNSQSTGEVKGGANKTGTVSPNGPVKKETTRLSESKQAVKKVSGKKKKTVHVKPVFKKTETVPQHTPVKK